MRALISSFLLPPQTPDYERTQQAKLLHVALIAVLLASLAIAAINVDMGAIGLISVPIGLVLPGWALSKPSGAY
jgi:hypothetical protein